MLCFAYDSDAPRDVESVPAWLPDHAAATQGGATVVFPCVGTTLAGELFNVSASNWDDFDAREAKRGRRRAAVRVLTDDGHAHHAHAYLAAPSATVADRDHPPTPDALFVYGTLMRDQARHDLIDRFTPRSIEAAQTRGQLVEIDWYPGLVMADHEVVHGELVRFERLDALFRTLDPYEDFAGYEAAESLYLRGLVRVQTKSQHVLSWAYVFLGATDGLGVIESGDWRVR